MKRAVVLVGHGTVDDLGDLPAFLTNIRRGQAPSDALVAELRHRYEAIGGRSPLNAISRRLAAKLQERLGVPVRLASRLWKPDPKDVLAALAMNEAVDEVIVLPLAQHSAHVYVEGIASGAPVPVKGVANWGQTPALLDAFAARVRRVLASFGDTKDTALVLSAHSLPRSVIAAGDAYEREARASAEGVAMRVRDVLPDAWVAFQSRGMSTGLAVEPHARATRGSGREHRSEWLGPDLPTTFDTIAARGKKRVLVAPIGFLADHVEILYDIDIEAKRLAKERGLALARTESLNDADDFVEILAGLVRPLLSERA